MPAITFSSPERAARLKRILKDAERRYAADAIDLADALRNPKLAGSSRSQLESQQAELEADRDVLALAIMMLAPA